MMEVALFIAGYVVIGLVVASLAARYLIKEDEDAAGLVTFTAFAFWPMWLQFGAVIGAGFLVVQAAKWLAALPERRHHKQVVQRDAVREMWEQELRDSEPDSVRHFVATQMLTLHEEE